MITARLLLLVIAIILFFAAAVMGDNRPGWIGAALAAIALCLQS